jgi:monoamine oxidase
MTDYDICIIGAGISGLYCARELSRAMPDTKICILEKYEFIGGRISTFKKTVPGVGHIQWEAGAGRIHKSHIATLDLLKEYNIDVIPIPSGIEWRSEELVESSVPVEFGKYIENLQISQISPEVLQKKTLQQILEQTLGKDVTKQLTDRYEYRSELDTLRADKGLESLHNELGATSGFFIVKGGFSSLIGSIKRDLTGIKIIRNYEVKDIHKIKDGYSISGKGRIPIRASRVIVTIPRDAIALIPCFKNLQILKQVKMRPLVRMYAVFPVINGKAWFSGIQRFVCKQPIRFVIPIDSRKGIIMISYTDGEDAEYWIKKGDDSVLKEVMNHIRKLFSTISIPDPLYFKIHPWSDGCSYWTPGAYSIDKVSMASVIPLPEEMPGVYMCNESWAQNQCWVNSAIEQSKYAIKIILDN